MGSSFFSYRPTECAPISHLPKAGLGKRLNLGNYPCNAHALSWKIHAVPSTFPEQLLATGGGAL